MSEHLKRRVFWAIVVLILIQWVLIFRFMRPMRDTRFWPAEVPSDHFVYSREQVAKIFAPDGSCGTILYFQQNPLWFYGIQGALKCGALVPYFYGGSDPEIVRMASERKDVTHAVLFNPLYDKNGTFLNVSTERRYALRIGADFASPLRLKFIPTQGNPQVAVTVNGRDRQVIEVPSETTWELPGRPKNGDEIVIEQVSGMARLTTIDLGQKDTHFPWGQPASFAIFMPDDEKKLGWKAGPVVPFTIVDEYLKNFPYTYRAIDDEQASILLKLVPKLN